MVLPWTLYSISSWSVVAPVAETILIAMKLLGCSLVALVAGTRRHTCFHLTKVPEKNNNKYVQGFVPEGPKKKFRFFKIRRANFKHVLLRSA